MTIGEKIYEMRKKLGMSQEELALQLNVSRQSISKWERDEAIPDTDKIIALSSVFSISTDYLLLDHIQQTQQEKEKAAPATGSKTGNQKKWGIALCISGGVLAAFLICVLAIWRLLLLNYGHTMGAEMLPAVNILNSLFVFAGVGAALLLAAGFFLLRKRDKR